MHFKDSAILFAVQSSTESIECGNKKNQEVEKNLPLNNATSYSLATRIASSLFCCICKTSNENNRLITIHH
jgi:hypothetical protein